MDQVIEFLHLIDGPELWRENGKSLIQIFYQKSVGSADDAQTESQFVLVDFDGRFLARLDFANGRVGQRLVRHLDN